MNLRRNGNGVLEITLSKRNLLALLHKLEMPDSARTIHRITKIGYVVVKAEDDETHYAERTPGPMHPDTEAFIEERS